MQICSTKKQICRYAVPKNRYADMPKNNLELVQGVTT